MSRWPVQPAGFTTVQMSDDQNVVPYSKLGSARSCPSLTIVSSSEPVSEKRRRFGEPSPSAASASTVAFATTVCATVLGEASGYFSSHRAATPATNGAAAEVPLATPDAVGLV